MQSTSNGLIRAFDFKLNKCLMGKAHIRAAGNTALISAYPGVLTKMGFVDGRQPHACQRLQWTA